jgi:hypothetical protein
MRKHFANAGQRATIVIIALRLRHERNCKQELIVTRSASEGEPLVQIILADASGYDDAGNRLFMP